MVEIPPALTSAITEQRAILFLGAGASRDAKHPTGKQIPHGHHLRDLISDRFLNGKLKDRPLSAVAAVAASEAGLLHFQTYIRELFLPFQPADFHLLLPSFRWRTIATTNFDLIVERAYENAPKRLQNLVKSVKDADEFDYRLHRETDPLGFYKLHGCIDYYTDLEIPLILGTEQYASYESRRTRFYARFRDLAFENPVIFAGYSLSDPHIQRILFDLTDPGIGRPPYYLVAPNITDLEVRYWAGHKVYAIACGFEEFLTTLDNIIPLPARELPAGIGGGELSIRRHYRVADAPEPQALVSYLADDVVHVHSGMAAPYQNAAEFYRGYDNGWGCIVQNLDAHRSVSDSVLVDAVLLEEANRRGAELFMLKGPAGNGKTVALKRIAWEAAASYDQIVFYVANPAGLRLDLLAEVHRLTGKRIFLFVDRVAVLRSELRDLLRSARGQALPVSVIGAERDNEWSIYCEQLEPFVRQEFAVRYLSEREIRELLVLLERHNALGLLREISPEERLRAFTDRAERQLLVALHEATLGVPFEEIVVDEFRRIEPVVARNVYLDICALHQFGAPVRAGLISRASGVPFEQFERELIRPLQNVVHIVRDGHNKDVFYRTRHQHVAEMVFSLVLPRPEDRFDLLARLLNSINVDYSSDRETFSRLIRGRGIAEIFPSADLGRLFYDRIQEAAPNDPFVSHQRAVFEMQHAGGSLVLAEAAAARAFGLNPSNHSIQHTQAEIARRLANETDDPLRKRALRRFTREKLGTTLSRLTEYDLYTRARLATDELRDLLDSLSGEPEERLPAAFIAVAKEAETTIQRGLQLFPESAELLATEASFRELLDQTARAQQALERAFRSNPRQDWLAVRLARKYLEAGNLQAGKEVLESCLRENPASKVVHMELGRLLVRTGDRVGGLQHLRRGFTEGDNNYEAQFWYARELFFQGHFGDAEGRFAALNERAPGRFRTRAAAPVEEEGVVARYQCRVQRKEEGYAFLKLPQFPSDVFASRADSEAAEWDRLQMGASATCALAFNRRGARAVSVAVA